MGRPAVLAFRHGVKAPVASLMPWDKLPPSSDKPSPTAVWRRTCELISLPWLPPVITATKDVHFGHKIKNKICNSALSSVLSPPLRSTPLPVPLTKANNKPFDFRDYDPDIPDKSQILNMTHFVVGVEYFIPI